MPTAPHRWSQYGGLDEAVRADEMLMRKVLKPELNHINQRLEPMKNVALGLICILTNAMPAIAWEPGDDWRDDQCESVIDGADRVANVCRGVYGRGEVFLGIYWND
ncbi:hypothetical protein MITS9509_03477 [Synechococcus sp. MIT S9509]|uniref:hypothetical protein n=1 Tax=unclassified Synechococcus TaxID=2626047 RepID=UPI0007BB5CA7|nr:MULTISPECIES: hypothetical protein [unclassified Synechococcus]KZR82233.1 hypothetical protein MITS9504_03483 [Synechococcus sp. MIT S9504]KZR86506.1 hypothetical protein MITS9509_03477 [Synechococcus sp. MIT S9509]